MGGRMIEDDFIDIEGADCQLVCKDEDSRCVHEYAWVMREDGETHMVRRVKDTAMLPWKWLAIPPPINDRSHRFNWRWLCGYLDPVCAWFRFGVDGPGLQIKTGHLLFSERNGHRKSLRIPFTSWRILALKGNCSK